MANPRKPTTLHVHMQRVYRAARAAGKIGDEDGVTSLAALINESTQMVENWHTRGPSAAGLLKLQAAIGVNATWVQNNDGPMLISAGLNVEERRALFGGPVLATKAHVEPEPWPFPGIPWSRYRRLPDAERKTIETFAQGVLAAWEVGDNSKSPQANG
jgi:hypothetical protein